MNEFIVSVVRGRDFRGLSSFYGVHDGADVSLDPEISIEAPINDLYGPHISFEGAVWQEDSLWGDEEQE